MLDLICTYLGIFVDIGILVMFLSVNESKMSGVRLCIMYLVYGLLSVCLNMGNVPFFVRTIFNIVAISIIVFEGYNNIRRQDGIKLSLLFLILLGVPELIVTPVMILTEGVYDIDIFYDESLIWLVTLLVSRLITVFLIRITRKITRSNKYLMNKSEGIVLYFPLIVSFTMFVMVEHYLIHIEEFDKRSVAVLLTTISVLLMFFTLVHMKLFENILLIKSQDYAIRELKYKNEIQYQYYKDKAKYENQIRILEHDLKNHLLFIERNITNENNLDYIKRLRKSMESHMNFESGCHIFDILVNEKSQIAKEKGINIEVNITSDISAINIVDEVDLCAIIGNLLDNAIEGSLKVSSPKIIINADIINKFFVLIIKNKYYRKPVVHRNLLVTYKEDDWKHGIGLMSVKESIGKYDGCFKYEWDNEFFYAKVLIPL